VKLLPVVMAGLDPAIHDLLRGGSAKKDVDARHKAGHDGLSSTAVRFAYCALTDSRHSHSRITITHS
jgi:hypothetical protein